MDWYEASTPRPLACVEVDTEAARRNLRTIVDRTGRPALCVVKADAYGHGAVRIANTLENEPSCVGFAVARMEEAASLRPGLTTAAPILCFGTFLAARRGAERKELLASCRELGVEPVLASAEDVGALLALPARALEGLRFHLAVDTGMTREGIGVSELPELWTRLREQGLESPAIWTHFSASEEPDSAATSGQLEAFVDALEGLPDLAGAIHLENSAAALHRLGERLPLDLRARITSTRVGGALYGLDLRAEPDRPRLDPVMQVRTRLVQLRTVPRGTAVGYGGSWVAPRDSVVGLVALGYADGLRSPVPDLLWHGRERTAPLAVVGRVSMDLVTVDCTEVSAEGPGPQVGDEVVVLGRSRGHALDARAHAEAAGIVDYAVTVGFSLRLPRWPEHGGQPPSAPPGSIL